jgi:hypothetical protein
MNKRSFVQLLYNCALFWRECGSFQKEVLGCAYEGIFLMSGNMTT